MEEKTRRGNAGEELLHVIVAYRFPGLFPSTLFGLCFFTFEFVLWGFLSALLTENWFLGDDSM